jgi:peroxiredoxin
MKIAKAFILLYLLLALSVPAQHKNVILVPIKPVPGDEITITYNPMGTVLEKSPEVTMYVMQYDNNLKSHDECVMEKQDNLWHSKFKLALTTLTAIIWFSSDEAFENNGGKGYVVNMHAKDGTILPGALGAEGTHSARMSNFLFVPDFVRAEELFKAEFKTNPKSKSDYLGCYFFAIQRNRPDSYKETIKKELDSLTARGNLSESELSLCVDYYKRISDTTKAEKIEEEFKQRYPGHKYFQIIKYMQFAKIMDVDEKIKFAQKFKEEFPNGEMNDNISSTITNALIGKGRFSEACAYWTKNINHISIPLCNTFAWGMYEKGGDLVKASEIAKTAIEEGRKIFAAKTYKRDNFQAVRHAEMSYSYDLGYLMDTYGSIQLKLNNKDEAYKAFEEAFYLTKKCNEDIDERYICSLIDKSEVRKAQLELESLIKGGTKSEKLFGLLKKVFALSNDSKSSYDQYFSRLEDEADAKDIRILKDQMVNEPAPDFTLVDLKGSKVSLSDFRGQKVIVDFWSTSCGPCVASMPAMKMAVEKLEKKGKIKFLFLNDQSADSDKKENLEKFIKDKNYPFHVLMDEKGKVKDQYKILGIPATLIIDENGIIKFRDAGCGGSYEYLANQLRLMLKLAGK